MACQFGVISRTKTQGKEPGQVVGSTGSMWYTSDDRSDMVAGHRTKRSDPAVVPVLVTLGARSGRHTTKPKVPTWQRVPGVFPVQTVGPESPP